MNITSFFRIPRDHDQQKITKQILRYVLQDTHDYDVETKTKSFLDWLYISTCPKNQDVPYAFFTFIEYVLLFFTEHPKTESRDRAIRTLTQFVKAKNKECGYVYEPSLEFLIPMLTRKNAFSDTQICACIASWSEHAMFKKVILSNFPKN